MKSLRRALADHRASWDDTCTRCGLCCYEKGYARDGSIYIDLSAPCGYLDPETKLCTVYDRRFELCEACKKVTIFHALFSRYMPPECAYVKRFRKWGFPKPPRYINAHR